MASWGNLGKVRTGQGKAYSWWTGADNMKEESLRISFSFTLYASLLHFVLTVMSTRGPWVSPSLFWHFLICGFVWLPGVVTISGSSRFIYFLFFGHILRHFRYFTGDNSHLFKELSLSLWLTVPTLSTNMREEKLLVLFCFSLEASEILII